MTIADVLIKTLKILEPKKSTQDFRKSERKSKKFNNFSTRFLHEFL